MALSVGLVAEAEGLLRVASSKAGPARARTRQVDALTELQALYIGAGRLRLAAAMAAQLQVLAGPR